RLENLAPFFVACAGLPDDGADFRNTFSDPDVDRYGVAVKDRPGEPKPVLDRNAERSDELAGQDASAQTRDHDARCGTASEACGGGVAVIYMDRPTLPHSRYVKI